MLFEVCQISVRARHFARAPARPRCVSDLLFGLYIRYTTIIRKLSTVKETSVGPARASGYARGALLGTKQARFGSRALTPIDQTACQREVWGSRIK